MTNRFAPPAAAGERPQAAVPAHAWQAAQSLGDWTLVGCTVAPGFDFADDDLIRVAAIHHVDHLESGGQFAGVTELAEHLAVEGHLVDRRVVHAVGVAGVGCGDLTP